MVENWLSSTLDVLSAHSYVSINEPDFRRLLHALPYDMRPARSIFRNADISERAYEATLELLDRTDGVLGGLHYLCLSHILGRNEPDEIPGYDGLEYMTYASQQMAKGVYNAIKDTRFQASTLCRPLQRNQDGQLQRLNDLDSMPVCRLRGFLRFLYSWKEEAVNSERTSDTLRHVQTIIDTGITTEATQTDCRAPVGCIQVGGIPNPPSLVSRKYQPLLRMDR